MKNSMMIKLVCATSLGALTACGGGGGPTVVEVETLSSTAEATSTLGGAALQSNGTTGVLAIVSSEGTLRHDTGATTLDDGTYVLTDSNGLNGDDQLTDGTSVLSTSTSGFTGSYDFTRAYEQTYAVDGVSYDSTGVGGVVLPAGDMPTSGDATFTGEAVGTVNVAADGFDLSGGTSTVTAAFTSDGGTVDVVLNGFTSASQSGDETTTNPIDTISALGMTIDGNGFSGGTLTTSLAGEDVDVLGTGATSAAAGNFFGYDEDTEQPPEVGGVVLMQGDDGLVTGAFIAN